MQQSNVSGILIFNVLMGLFICAVAPPVGLLMIGLGVAHQRQRCNKLRGAARARAIQRAAVEVQRERQGRIVAWKSFGA